MRPWVRWRIERHMSWVVQFAMLLCIPVYLAAGCYTGCVELLKEWRQDWRLVQREARAAQEKKT